MKNVILQRALLYGCAIALITLLYFGFDLVFQQLVPEDSLRDVAAAIVAGLGFPHFKKAFEKWTDPWFFRGEYRYADAVRELSERLSGTIEVDSLLQSLAEFLSRTVKVSTITFFIAEEKRCISYSGVFAEHRSEQVAVDYPLSEFKDFLINPVFIGENRHRLFGDALYDRRFSALQAAMRAQNAVAAMSIFRKDVQPEVRLQGREKFSGAVAAMLVLGRKRCGRDLDPKDRDLLSVLSHQAGIALSNAWLYEKVKQHAGELERRVAEKTVRIAAMHRAQSDFLAELSHEFQTPLAILQGNIELIAPENPHSVKKAVYVMETTVDRLSRLVSGLVNAAKIRFTDSSGERSPIRVDDLIKDAYQDCCFLAEDKGVALSFASESFSVSGNRDKLKEVLLNLLSNAIRHTPHGGSITMTARMVEEEGEIVVADTGKGIPAHALPHIFDRFYRIRDGSSRGTGLGLHICRQIIEAHAGTIVATSTVGAGSQFVLRLPAAVAP